MLPKFSITRVKTKSTQNATNDTACRISQAKNAIAKPYKTGDKTYEYSALEMANNKAKKAGKLIEQRFAELVTACH